MKYGVLWAILFAPLWLHATVEPQTSNIRNNLHMIVSPEGGNVVISVGEDGAFLIDDQLKHNSERIEMIVRDLGGDKINFILNTHYHFDHTGGNEFFGEKGAIILAHENIRKRLSTKQFITYFKKEMPATTKEGLPVITFTQDMTLHYNGNDVRMIHVPNAHTDGDVVAHFENDNVIVVGDLIFNQMYPFIDVEHGGTILGTLAGLDILIERADEKAIIVPGHGPLMSKADVVSYREVLDTISERVRNAIGDQKTLKQILEMNLTKEFDSHLHQDIVDASAFVALLYQDMVR